MSASTPPFVVWLRCCYTRQRPSLSRMHALCIVVCEELSSSPILVGGCPCWAALVQPVVFVFPPARPKSGLGCLEAYLVLCARVHIIPTSDKKAACVQAMQQSGIAEHDGVSRSLNSACSRDPTAPCFVFSFLRFTSSRRPDGCLG